MSSSTAGSRLKVLGIFAFVVLVFFTLAVRVTSLTTEIARLRHELETTRTELETAHAELEAFRYAPERLAAQIDDALSARAIDSARHYLDLLARYHPQAPERKEAEAKLNALVARIAAEERAAEQRRLAAEKAAREREAKALRAMRKSTDDMRGLVFYQDPFSPRYVNLRSALYYYISHKPGSLPTLRARVIYKGDDWVFFNTVLVKVGDEVFRFTFDHFEVQRDNGYGDVWEWVDVLAIGDWMRLAQRLKEGPRNIRVRFEGRPYYREFTMHPDDVAAVRKVLDAYEYLKKNPHTT